MLDHHPKEPLEAAQDGAVQHHRRLSATVRGDVFGIEPGRKLHVHLKGAALPLASDGVAQYEIQLGAVERAVARVQHRLDPGADAGLPQGVLGLIPLRIAADAYRGPIGEPHRELREPEVAVDHRQQFDEARTLAGDLLFRAEDMGTSW
jgi:hypothetical protein